MLASLRVPRVITGAFNIIVTLIQPTAFSREDIVIETLEGDALGTDRDVFSGEGKFFRLLCYVPHGRNGKAKVSLPRFDVADVVVEYDTVIEITATWGAPVLKTRQVEIPFTLSHRVRSLKKKLIRLSKNYRFYLYGSGTDYRIVVNTGVYDFDVTIRGIIEKPNGRRADILESTLFSEQDIVQEERGVL